MYNINQSRECMYYIIYKTTNIINNKWYIGFHSTLDINDRYLGSGKILKKAIKKYGRESFTKELLYVYNDKTEALNKEKEIVNNLIVEDDESYNLKIGGEGGWDHIITMIKKDIKFKKNLYSKVSETIKKLYKEGKIKSNWDEYNRSKPFKGKTHSKESKKKISKNNKSKLQEEEIKRRMEDFNNEDKSYGYISRLSKKWNISHTSVKRFIKKYGGVA